MVVDENQGLTLLHSSCFFGNIKAMKTLIEKYSADVNLTDYRGQTPLHISVLSGNLQSLAFMCELEKDKEYLNRSEEVLESQGLRIPPHIDLEVKDNALMTPLMNSVLASNDHVFVYLYFKGVCDLSNLDFNGNSLLHLAAQSNSINIAKLLRHMYKLQCSSTYSRHTTAFENDDAMSENMVHDSLIYFDVNRVNLQG
jgi:ankyrin repeat protein